MSSMPPSLQAYEDSELRSEAAFTTKTGAWMQRSHLKMVDVGFYEDLYMYTYYLSLSIYIYTFMYIKIYILVVLVDNDR